MLQDADRLVRFHAFGFLVIWPLLGAAAVSAWTPRIFIGIAAVTLCFNTFGAILNDVVDLPVDRTNPLRARDPLVRGIINRRQALMIAVLQIPLMATAHWAAGFPWWTLTFTAFGLAGMAVYDLWSKTSRLPPAAEASQAAAGFMLVLYGATVTGRPLTGDVWPVALSAAAFILFVNAFHGGLRDIENDWRWDQRTTPIWLGCRAVEGGKVHITVAMSLYSAILQGLLIGLAIWVTASAGDEFWTVPVVAAAAVNVILFMCEHTVRKPAWDVLLRVHVVSAAVPLMLAFAPRLGVAGSAWLFATYFVPMLVMDRSHLAAGPVTMGASQARQMSPTR